MQNVMPESLQNIKNDWMDIYRESGGVEEMLMATYSRALEFDCFSLYRPRYVSTPSGCLEAYQDYLTVNDENKPSVWKGICKKFGGYLKARSEADHHNASCLGFLEEMRDFFEKKGLLRQAETCRLRMNEFKGFSVAA